MAESPNLSETKVETQSTTFSLDILNATKTAQNQHGLRISDYQRYRHYCTRRARRIRKTLKFGHGKSKFQRKQIEAETVTDVKFLLLVLVKSEAAWSYAMDLKDRAAQEPRVRHHMHRKLKKAAKWAKHLETLCTAKSDKRTTLEAEAYASFMSGNYHFEKEEWKEALQQFIQARTIYDQLGKVVEAEYQDLFKQKVEELEPSIRYCNYRLKGTQDASSNLDLNKTGPGSDLLQSKLNSVIAEALKKQADTMKEISWRGKRIPIKNEKLRLSIVNAQEVSVELDRAESFDNKISLFDKLFIAYNDASNLIREELREFHSQKQKNVKAEMQEEHLNALKTYVNYHKLIKTIERNEMMVSSLERRLNVQENSSSSSSSTAGTASATTAASASAGSEKTGGEGSNKRSKPEDLVRVYESLIQNHTELTEFSEDPEQSKEIAAKILSFKAIRCYYLGLSYSHADKLAEARALFDRAADQIKQAKSHHQACKNPLLEQIKKLEEIEGQIKGEKCETNARAFLENLKSQRAASQEESTPNNTNQKKSLLNSLDEFDYSTGKDKELISFPPDFEAVRCKPVLFDLALGEIEFPSLEAKTKAKGGFWGFWGRG